MMPPLIASETALVPKRLEWCWWPKMGGGRWPMTEGRSVSRRSGFGLRANGIATPLDRQRRRGPSVAGGLRSAQALDDIEVARGALAPFWRRLMLCQSLLLITKPHADMSVWRASPCLASSPRPLRAAVVVVLLFWGERGAVGARATPSSSRRAPQRWCVCRRSLRRASRSEVAAAEVMQEHPCRASRDARAAEPLLMGGWQSANHHRPTSHHLSPHLPPPIPLQVANGNGE